MAINDGPCNVDGCDRDADVRGWCSAHYKRWLDFGDVKADQPLQGSVSERGCQVKDCKEDHYARGWCHGHYARVLRTGSAQPEIPILRRR